MRRVDSSSARKGRCFRLLPWLLLASVLPAASPMSARAETILFLVAETPAPVHGDSYVLPISDPLAIAQARDLVASGPGGAVGSIAVAQIAAGSDGINRNALVPAGQFWSWHVTQFGGFADVTLEICDGWPTYVESDVAGWIANTGGTICFWNYTVVAELGPLDAVPVMPPVAWGVTALVLLATGVRQLAGPPLFAA